MTLLTHVQITLCIKDLNGNLLIFGNENGDLKNNFTKFLES